MSDEKDEGIKVVDRRRFTEDGDEKDDASEHPEVPAGQGAPESVKTPPPQASTGGGGEEDALLSVDFVTFILSLSQTAVLSLGLGPEDGSGQAPPRDLQAAKWTIDALQMLQKKTEGNLTGEEERIFERLLAELKVAYVQVAGGGGNA